MTDLGQPRVDTAGSTVAFCHLGTFGEGPGDVGGRQLHRLVIGIHAAPAYEGLLSWFELEALDDLIKWCDWADFDQLDAGGEAQLLISTS